MDGPEDSCAQILESPHLDDLRCSERYTKRSEENLQQIESGRETFDEKDEAIEVVNVLQSLTNTRESLSANASLLEQSGQLLDKALAKQIAIRESELDSSGKSIKKNVSVIVRCSTPDPSAECPENNPESHFPISTPRKVPEDFSLPLNYLLKSFDDNLETPPIPPRHPRCTPPVHPAAPEVPWSPSRSVQGAAQTSLYEDFQSPRRASLIKPLICLNNAEVDMADFSKDKEECEEKIEAFDDVIRRCNPKSKSPSAVKRCNVSWDNELKVALDDLTKTIRKFIRNHSQILEEESVGLWKQEITAQARKYDEHVTTVHGILDELESRSQSTPTPALHPPSALPVPDAASVAKARAAEVEVQVDAERIVSDGNQLSEEYMKYDDWGDASNEEVEEAARSIKDWRKKFRWLEDRVYTMKKNVKLYNLANTELDSSIKKVESIQLEMERAIHGIKEEDEVRGLFTLSQSKASDLKLPKFGGKPHENFAKFRMEMMRAFKANKIRREDQVKKLRENLFDQPKTMIPYTMEYIEDAWQVLGDMYGDAGRVMHAMRLELKKLKENADGGYPRRGTGLSLLKSQIEWITRLEVTINSLIELGEESEQLDRDAFGSKTVGFILNLFSFQIQDELALLLVPAGESGKEKLRLIVKFLKTLRNKRQCMQKAQELDDESDSDPDPDPDSDPDPDPDPDPVGGEEADD